MFDTGFNAGIVGLFMTEVNKGQIQLAVAKHLIQLFLMKPVGFAHATFQYIALVGPPELFLRHYNHASGRKITGELGRPVYKFQWLHRFALTLFE